MNIRVATIHDVDIISDHDKHISKRELETSVSLSRVYIAESESRFVGWLRFNLFWDNTPFLNMLYILPDRRNSGFGQALLRYWETQMRQAGFRYVLTSTAANETAQDFYKKFGYVNIGGFDYANDPHEMILQKRLLTPNKLRPTPNGY